MIKLPEGFRTVILKMIPEISEIDIINFEVITHLLGGNIIDTEERFTIVLNLVIKDDEKILGGKHAYTESINTLFKYVHSDINFVRFRVENISITKKQKNKEIFMSLFGVNNKS
jgi:hypothetical protein